MSLFFRCKAASPVEPTLRLAVGRIASHKHAVFKLDVDILPPSTHPSPLLGELMGMMMPMPQKDFEIDSDSRASAEKYARSAEELLLESSYSDPGFTRQAFLRTIFAQAEAKHLDDFNETLQTAAEDFAAFRLNERFPVIKTEEGFVPLSMKSLLGDLSVTKGRSQALRDRQFLDGVVERWADQSDGRFIGTFGQVMESFRSNLTGFLSYRFAGLRFWSNRISNTIVDPDENGTTDNDGPVGSTDGRGLFHVTVTCKATAYRILVSPAYFIDWVYFGSPSTPVSKWLLPGRYVFGTDSIDSSVTNDPLIFRVPDDYIVPLQRF